MKADLKSNHFENLLKINAHYVMNEIEEIIPYDSVSDEEREKIIKVAMKTIETTTIVMHEFLKEDSVNYTKIDEAVDFLDKNKYEEAYKFIFEKN